MVQFNAVKRVTVTEQIMEQIADIITSGELKPGEKLPNERDLAEKFQVTRSRVREALRALSLIGLITIKPGEGSFVNRHQVSIPAETISWMYRHEVHNINEVYDARKLIETEVFLSAFDLCKEEQLIQMEKFTDDILEASKKSIQPEEFVALLDQHDLYMGEICGNQIFLKLMQTIVHLRRKTSLKIIQIPGAREQSAENRAHMLKAFKSKNREKVKKSIDSFYQKSRQFYETVHKNNI